MLEVNVVRYVGLSMALLLVSGSVSGESPKPAIGATVGKVSFSDIRFNTRTLDDFGPKQAFVLVFASTTCPVAKRYLPRLNELHAAYDSKGVQFVLVNVAPEDTIKDMGWQAMEYGLAFPVVKDLDGELAKAAGASITPQSVVLDSKHAIRYRGRIDDQYRTSGVQPNIGRSDLKEAIEEVLAGKPVTVAETPVEGCAITFDAIPKPNRELTFAHDVAPIVYKHCAQCHHEGTEAPFALTTFEQVSGKAGSIAQVVRQGQMPPWYAHPEFGKWLNARNMTDDERRTLVQWAKSGRASGDLAIAPKTPEFPATQWIIGEPDLVLEAKEEDEIPAEGIIDYKYATLQYVFPEDTWVQGIQIQPSNPSTVHHANVVYTIGDKGYVEDENFLTGRVPGGSPAIMNNGVAMLIPKGAVLTVQIHYVTNGTAQKSRMRVGLRYAKETIHKRARHKVIRDGDFSIPPGAPAQVVTGTKTLECDATGVALFVHMHLRGKNSVFTATYPDGKKETLLAIPNYSFDWQMPYLFMPGEKQFPKGTIIECKSQFDNSPFNPYNPDPKVEVKYGPQTFEEMMDGYMFYLDNSEDLNLTIDPKTGQIVKDVKTASSK
jgi:thiol-disulfide isomerase/thioredoxin